MQIRLVRADGSTVDRQWNVERCPYPGCAYFQEKHHNLKTHIKTHEDLNQNMEALGWF
jgi:hypothetical protein